ncbi:MAG TPA: glycosyltransferase family 1 protein, partial [Armatimonadetes bacterium]|nr:glycosyltransferase family 1 protein [Armatimonadota bacterium]
MSKKGEAFVRIGIDARTLFAPKTGDRTYTLNLLRHLPRVAPHREFFAIATSKRDEAILHDLPQLQFIFVSSLCGWQFTQMALPAIAKVRMFDLLHVQYIAPVHSPCPYVTTIHDVSWRRLPHCFPLRDRLLLNLFIPLTVHRAGAVITDSKASRCDIVNFYRVPLDKVHAIPLGVSDEFFATPSEIYCQRIWEHYGLECGYLLYIGVIQPRKNLMRVLTAIAMLRRAGCWRHQWRMVIAGKRGWHYEPLLRMASQLALHDAVKFIGYVPDEHLLALYHGARAFVYPSLWEGFGLPIVEAMAAGVPV